MNHVADYYPTYNGHGWMESEVDRGWKGGGGEEGRDGKGKKGGHTMTNRLIIDLTSPPATHPPPLLPFSSLWSLCWSAHMLQ